MPRKVEQKQLERLRAATRACVGDSAESDESPADSAAESDSDSESAADSADSESPDSESAALAATY